MTMATIITVVCGFRIERKLGPTRKAKEAIHSYSELLESAGVNILQTLIVPAANHIDFVIDAEGLDAAISVLRKSGISVTKTQ
jgi:hypothetical protein